MSQPLRWQLQWLCPHYRPLVLDRLEHRLAGIGVGKLLLLATHLNHCIKTSIVSKASILTSNYVTSYAYYRLTKPLTELSEPDNFSDSRNPMRLVLTDAKTPVVYALPNTTCIVLKSCIVSVAKSL